MYRFEDCELDPRRRELRRGGRPVHVEPQVFDVLVHLLQHRDRVVPKAELLDEVWGDRFVSDATLTSRLKAARRAVGDDGQGQRLIATVHGVGYRFRGDVVDGTTYLPDPVALPPVRHRDTQEIRYCHSPDGVSIAYATSGSGPPLVKAANWLTHLDLEWQSPIWAHWIDALSDGRRLIRYDERGCGLSDWQVTDFSLDAWVEDLELVIDSVGLERFPLIGLSQGGAVAVAYAVRHPDRVTHLVLVGAYARGRLKRAATVEEREEADLDLRVARVAWRRDDPAFRQVFAAQFLPDAPRALWDAFNEMQRATTSTENVVHFLEAFADLDVSAIAPQVACPTLILHARRDRRVPESQARELAALIPSSVLHLVDSGNHVVLQDEPAWPDVVDRIDAFLA
ncbi:MULTISPECIES: alpha/beta fold hydrolase [unclassified Nocardioides]|uniref:alpha/beta fold hydrolase n=1 Tax=unclassified Nocardioides TaxID=2615069 RepID=UPI003618496C